MQRSPPPLKTPEGCTPTHSVEPISRLTIGLTGMVNARLSHSHSPSHPLLSFGSPSLFQTPWQCDYEPNWLLSLPPIAGQETKLAIPLKRGTLNPPKKTQFQLDLYAT